MKKVMLSITGTFLGLITLNTAAKTPCCLQSTCCPPPSYVHHRPACGYFVDGNIGVSYEEWKRSGLIKNIISSEQTLTHSLTNDPIGFTGGFDAGYKINCHVAGEIGAYFLPTIDANWINTTPSDIKTGTATLSSWFGYAALKFMAPVFNNMDAFIKIGGAARNVQYRNDFAFFGDAGFPNTDTNSFNWLFGAGLQYYFNCAFSMNAQWLHLTGATVAIPTTFDQTNKLPSSISVPPLNLLVFGIGINLNNLF